MLKSIKQYFFCFYENAKKIACSFLRLEPEGRGEVASAINDAGNYGMAVDLLVKVSSLA